MVIARFGRRHAPRAACGILALCATAVVAPTTPAAAAPEGPDIAVTAVVPSAVIIPGAVFSVVAVVGNVGGDVSDPVTVTVTGPRSVSAFSGSTSTGWTCTKAASTFGCEHTPLEPGQSVPVAVTYRADTAVPGDVLTFTTVAAPEPGEATVTNNVGQESVEVVAPGVIRGTVWLDTNRDGQRQADEPRVSSETPGMVSITASPRSGPGDHQPHGGQGFAQADGTYSMTLEPGFFVLLVQVDRQVFRFTVPDVGDDATDSDLVQFQNDPFVNAGLSDVIGLASGGVAVVDVGIVPVT